MLLIPMVKVQHFLIQWQQLLCGSRSPPYVSVLYWETNSNTENGFGALLAPMLTCAPSFAVPNSRGRVKTKIFTENLFMF